MQLATDLVTSSGIVDISGTQFQVTANANMTVAVNAGRAYLIASGGNCYSVINTASATVTVSSNGNANPRITSIVLYIDLSASANSDASNVAKLTTVDGTPASSPSAPSGATVQAAVGASNPYLVLNNVTVPSGATNLSTQGTLVDQRTKVTFLGFGIKSRIYLAGAQNVSSGADTKILLDTVSSDPNSLFDAVNHRIVIATAGDYDIKTLLTYTSPGATGRFGAALFKNGSVVSGYAFANSNGATSVSAYLSDTIFGLAVNDYIELYGWQDSGGSKAITTGSVNTFLTIRKVG